MKKIFLWCIPVSNSDVVGYALAEDGTGLASHMSSNEEWSKHDMGLTSDWKHEIYIKHYPEGFELVWISDFKHDEFKRAFALNKKAN